MESLEWLQSWYLLQCNGDWEHSYGVKIDTLDNPGWSLEIDLTDTSLQNRPFEKTKIERTEDDWVMCEVEKNQFYGAGGPKNLGEIIQVFRNWIESETHGEKTQAKR